MLSQHNQTGPQQGTSSASDWSPVLLETGELALPLTEVIPPAVDGDRGGNGQSWRLLTISLLSCFAASGAALGAFLWLINLPPTANCESTAGATTDRAQLFCAQTAAESGELTDVLAALDLVSGWPWGHPLYSEVRPLVDRWSGVVLTAAEQELRNNGSMAEAQALVSHIPAGSPVFAQAQETLQGWQSEWDQGEAIFATAQQALQQRDWSAASTQVQALAQFENPYWRVEQVQTLAQQIRLERRAQALLEQAIATAAPGGSDRLKTALRTASQIDDSTYARKHAQPYLNRWSDLLLQLGLNKWYTSDLDTAIALGRSAALNPSRAQVAQELMWLSQSRQLAQQSLMTWRTSPDQVVTLYQAMVLANRISADSPYYPQAQSSVATWRSHLGDLARFQTAQAVGQVRTMGALKTAIDQAAEVPVGHPRRVQAQTMVAHWRQEIERLEDRPYLVKAHQMTKTGTIEGLQAAIQVASGVTLQRALRPEAQGWIYIWTKEIQTLEDLPMLARARSLATEGKLSQAIAEATGIKPGRALYDEAKAAIAGWQGEIAAAEQARQRALRRATTPAATPETVLEATAESLTENVDNLPIDLAPAAELTPSPLAPAPRPRQRRSPLPERIET
ncbi:hypothetical protein IQ254_26055, partial [Nodosilinea sp. LEGE 07088]|uniref:hypothetical protein n=1 Tax=Nodosilinea sp. LEGE 07088 TaxID=2777968 RepID=UPI001882CF08